jgi:hypothetical protein
MESLKSNYSTTAALPWIMDSTSTVASDFRQSGDQNDGGFDPVRCGGTADNYTNSIDEAVRRSLSQKIDEIVSGLIQEHRTFLQTGVEKVDTLIDDVKEKAVENSTRLWRGLDRCITSHEALATRMDQLCDIVEGHTKQLVGELRTVKVFYLKLRGEIDLELMLGATRQDSQHD